jgi:hypothetical protein
MKTREFNKKLVLNKVSIAKLDSFQIELIKGGGELAPSRACKTDIVKVCASDDGIGCVGAIYQ